MGDNMSDEKEDVYSAWDFIDDLYKKGGRAGLFFGIFIVGIVKLIQLLFSGGDNSDIKRKLKKPNSEVMSDSEFTSYS